MFFISCMAISLGGICSKSLEKIDISSEKHQLLSHFGFKNGTFPQRSVIMACNLSHICCVCYQGLPGKEEPFASSCNYSCGCSFVCDEIQLPLI